MRRCGNCGRVGHYRTTCGNPRSLEELDREGGDPEALDFDEPRPSRARRRTIRPVQRLEPTDRLELIRERVEATRQGDRARAARARANN